ncbi:MAG: hypothetical protein EXR09_10680 [Acetobacteraceae bacterium]|nr:hypothetical protein [Acetobacteraceae bacterium]
MSTIPGKVNSTITKSSGAKLRETVLHARGSLQAPLSNADLETKLSDCSRQGGHHYNPDA